MKLLSFLTLGFLGGALAQQQCPGSWYLQPDDCICMRSTDGALLKDQTFICCRQLGYKTYDNVSVQPRHIARTINELLANNLGLWQICAVDRNMRQTFKDCCKGLKQESVIGHCR
jgi:hypothetical protein